MRDAALLGARLLLGGYMGIHASQKLFGMFHGPGLDGIGAVFEKNGLTPGREMAMVAAATEIAGGVLTITGVAYPAGPLAVAGAMSVAAAHNREGGLMASRNGVELPVAYLTLALTLAAAGPGTYKLGRAAARQAGRGRLPGRRRGRRSADRQDAHEQARPGRGRRQALGRRCLKTKISKIFGLNVPLMTAASPDCPYSGLALGWGESPRCPATGSIEATWTLTYVGSVTANFPLLGSAMSGRPSE